MLIFSFLSSACSFEVKIDPYDNDRHEEKEDREERKEEKEEKKDHDDDDDDKKYKNCKSKCHGLTGQRRARCNHKCQGKYDD